MSKKEMHGYTREEIARARGHLRGAYLDGDAALEAIEAIEAVEAGNAREHELRIFRELLERKQDAN